MRNTISYKVRVVYAYAIVFTMWRGGHSYTLTITKANSSAYSYENILMDDTIPWHYENWMPINKLIRTADMRFKEVAGQTLLL